jgi:hypothetical protein
MPTKSTKLGDNPTPNVNQSPPTNTNELMSILPHSIDTTLDTNSNVLTFIASTSTVSKLTPPNWDKHGTDKCKSSIDVLMHWLTTKENATKHFVGLDKDVKNSSDRTEFYHNGISAIIKKENGKII